MKRVLVTGASGFIGQHSLKKLVSLGYEVHALSRKEIADTQGVFWHRVDLLDKKETTLLLEKIQPSQLLHFAWDVAPGYLNSVNNFDWVSTSLHLLKEFQKNGGKRVVFAGTCFQYDHSDGICNEKTTSRKAASLYGVCKQSLQEMFEKFCSQAGLSGAWGHIFFLYGPYEAPNRLVASVINSLRKGEKADCTEGRQIRDFLYVEDVADAFVQLLDSDVEGPVNIGSGKEVQLREIIFTIAEILDKKHLVNLGARPMSEGEPPKILADVTRLQKELNWKPKYSLKEGLEKTISCCSQ